jgi:phosphate starvation-inducible protein PhoH
MPDLPTITVTAPQATKLLELFGSANEYKKWLKEAVRVEAIRRQTVVLQEAANAQVRDAIMTFETEIPPADEPEVQP